MANVAPAELAKEFRSMLMRVAQKLTEDEMLRLSYEEGFTLELPPGSTGLQDMRVHFLHKLEAKGVFSPKNPDGFAGVLKRLSREDLIVEVNNYKQNHLLVKPTKKTKTKWKKSKHDEKAMVKKPSEAKKSITTENPQDDLEDMFALAMTHASNLMSVLEELRELMQQPIPRERLVAVTPQVKEAIVMLSKEEQAVASVCQVMRKAAADAGVRLPDHVSPQHSSSGDKGKKKTAETLMQPKSYKKPLLSLPKTPLSQSLSASFGATVVHKQDHGEVYDDIVSMSTLGQGYDTYDQVPIRNRPLLDSSSKEYYKKVPPQEEDGIYDFAVDPSCETEQPSYDNVVDSSNGVEEVNYDEIVDQTELDENNYGVVRHTDSGIGSGEAKPGEWLPGNLQQQLDSSPSELKDGLVENPMYVTKLPQERERGYMALLKQQVAEDEDSLYTNIVRRP